MEWKALKVMLVEEVSFLTSRGVLDGCFFEGMQPFDHRVLFRNEDPLG